MLLDTSEQFIHGQSIGAQPVREVSPEAKGKIMLCEEQQSSFRLKLHRASPRNEDERPNR
jgi:hypothetical protein